jgi:hypothetical protein
MVVVSRSASRSSSSVPALPTEPEAPPAATSTEGTRARWGAILEHVGALLVAMWTAAAFLRPDRLVVSFDTLAYSGPNMAFNAEELRSGRIPQWNDSIFGGVPQLGNIHAGALYPLRAAFAWVDPIRAVNLVAALHLLLLASGIVVLVRHRLGLRAPASVVAAAVVLGSGMMSARSLQLEQLIGLAWIPWLLAAVDWAVRGGGRERLAVPAVALVTAMLVTGGHGQSTFAGVAFAVVWGVARSCDVAVDRRAIRRLVPAGVGAALGLLLASPQLLATLALTERASSVSRRTLEDVANPAYVLPVKRVVATLFGDGSVADQALVTGNFEAMTSIGVAACALALLAVVVAAVARPERWTQLALAAVSLGALLLAVGPRLPLYRIAFELVPGLDSARVPGRWRDLTVLGVAFLAAFAIDHLARRRVDVRAAVAFTGVGVLGAVLVGVLPFDLPATRIVVAWAGTAACVAAVALAAGAAGHRLRPAVLPGLAALLLGAEVVYLGPPGAWERSQPVAVDEVENPVTEFLARQPERSFAFTTERLDDPAYVLAGLRPNANTFLGIRSIDGYDGGVQVTDEWVAATAALENPVSPDLLIRHQIRLPLEPALFARFGVRWVLYDTSMLPLDQLAPAWGDPVVEGDGLALLDNPEYHGEALLFGATVRADEGDLDELLAEQRAAAVVARGGPELSCSGCQPTSTEIDRPRPGALDAVVEAEVDSLLVIAEQWDPGWSASVDGRPAEVVLADGMFLGVEIGPGRHDVELRYTAPGLRLGVVLTLLGLIGCAGAMSGRVTGRLRRTYERLKM